MLIAKHGARGFTLIELVVGLTILAFLIAVAAPSFTVWIQNTQLRTAAESISGGLQLARSEAVRRNTTIQFALPAADSSWTLGCVVPVADLNGDGVEDCPAVIQSRLGTEGTKNAVVAADNPTVIFNGLGRANNAMTITVTDPIGGTCAAAGGPMRCLNVIVATGGQIRMCNPALPNTNPQGC